MLQKPSIPDQVIANCLQTDYGISAVHLTFLPLGADINTAVYHIQSPNHPPYFLKLRSGPFNPAAVILPKLLQEQGLNHIIAPLPTTDGRLYTTLEAYTVTLSPSIEGKNNYEVTLSDQQMVQFGRLLKQFHTTQFPPSLTQTIRRETYSSHWRDLVRAYLSDLDKHASADPISAETAAFLKTKHTETLNLVNHAERQIQTLQTQSPPFILCHADIHAGNIHITADNTFYLIDWDTLILAPKERDLMSIGASLMGRWRTPQEEETLFYQGYFEDGRTSLNPIALTYYRSERIIQDIAEFCHQIFTLNGNLQDRQQALHWLKSNYTPDSTIDLAFHQPEVRPF